MSKSIPLLRKWKDTKNTKNFSSITVYLFYILDINDRLNNTSADHIRPPWQRADEEKRKKRMFRATVTQFTSLQFVKNDLCILILLHLRFTWFMVDSFGTFRALLDYYFFLIIRFIYQNFVLDRFARCKRHELLSSRCSSTCSC